MKTTGILTNRENRTGESLHTLADQLITNFLPAALRDRNSMINNIPTHFYININGHVISSILRQVLQAVVVNTSNSVIYLSAKEIYSTMIEVMIKDDHCFHAYGIALNLQDAVKSAKLIGGSLTISNPSKNVTAVSFRFPK